MNKKLKTILGIGAGLFLIVAIFGYVKFFSNNTTISKDEMYVTIPTGSTYDDVKKIMTPYVGSMSGFDLMASLRKYDSNVKPGRFLIKKGMGNFAIGSFIA